MLKPVRGPICHFRHTVLIFPFNRTPPDCENPPALILELPAIARINLPVAVNFISPELFPGCGPLEQIAIVPVPETTVYKNHSIIFREDQVGLSWQTFVVKFVTESFGEKRLTNKQFRPGIFALHIGHTPPSLFRGQRIRHFAIHITIISVQYGLHGLCHDSCYTE